MDDGRDLHDSVVFEIRRDPDTGRQGIHIAHAAPRTRVTRAVLNDAGSHPSADRLWHIDGDVLTLTDDFGQRFIYRIDYSDFDGISYAAEWPD